MVCGREEATAGLGGLRGMLGTSQLAGADAGSGDEDEVLPVPSRAPPVDRKARRGSVHTVELQQFLDLGNVLTEDNTEKGGGSASPSARQAAISDALSLGVPPRQGDKSTPQKNVYSYHQRDVRPGPPRPPPAVSRAFAANAAAVRVVQVERAALSPQGHPTSAALYSIWRTADADGNGFLSETEIKNLNAQLKTHWNFDDMWIEIQQMYEGSSDARTAFVSDNGSRQVGYGAFVQFYNTRMGAERRKHRLEVKAQFEKMDVDRSGTLDFDEVQKLIKRCKKLLLLLPPEYDAEADWNDMTLGAPEGSMQAQGITFADFERWWKDRMGLVEADTPVLPEFFSHKLKQIREGQIEASPGSPTDPLAGGSPHARLRSGSFMTPKPAERRLRARSGTTRSRTGSELWNFLTPRLRVMAAMKKEWGDLHDIYGHTESLFAEPPIPQWIRDPESNFSVVWDLVQIVFLLYVSITVPMRASFEVVVEFMSFEWWFDTLVDVYFIVDLVLNFRTAYVNSKGVRETRPRTIAKNYICGWFFIDFVSCIPVGHISYAIEQAALSGATSSTADGADAASPDNLKALKSLRLLKLSKMLRLARLKRIMQKYENLMVVQEYMGIFFMLAVIVFTAHFLTCIWYSVGNDPTPEDLGYYHIGSEGYEENNELVQVVGWVYLEPWSDRDSNDLVVSTSTKFISSMYYVFNALDGNGNTDVERMTAVFAYMMMVMIDGAVAGVMSALLIGMSGNEREVTDKLRAIKQWMTAHRVPRLKQAHALTYFSHHFKEQLKCSEAEILADMPPAMRDEFRTHLYGKFLASVPMFRDLSQEILGALCGAVQPMVAVKQQVIFEEGSTGNEMYMLMFGELEVSQGGQRLGFLSDGAFFGEVPILDDSTGSEVRARTITAMTDSKLCYLTSKDLAELRGKYPELELRLKRFSKIGANRKTKAKGLKLQEAALIKKSLAASSPSEQSAAGLTTRSQSPISAILSASFRPSESAVSPAPAAEIMSASQLQMLETKMTRLIALQVDTLSAQLNQKLDTMASQLGINPAMGAHAATASADAPTDLDRELAALEMNFDAETILPGSASTVQGTGNGNRSFRLP